jgi:hypothetical protein
VFNAQDRGHTIDSNYIGDHVDALIRYDSDGSYQKAPHFLTLLPNGQLTTYFDASVKEFPGDPTVPPTGVNWQIGSGFTPILGPTLTTDPPNNLRVYAFFAPESQYDKGVGGHQLGFASTLVPTGSTSPFTFPASSLWRDSTSYNDGSNKLSRQVPLYTLYVSNYTPVVSFRGDTGIASQMTNNGRYVGGLTGWYSNGYFYLLLGTGLSQWVPECSPSYPTSVVYGALLLLRVKSDTTTANGLYLDATKRPQVEMLYSDTAGGPKYFHILPHPDKVITFADDNKPYQCTGDNRQNFTGCCDNPPVPAANAAILTFPSSVPYLGYLPSSTTPGYLGANEYVTLSEISPQAPNFNARILRITPTGITSPFFWFANVATVTHPTPAGYSVDTAYYAVNPNIAPLNPSSSGSPTLGYRHVLKASSSCEGQAAMTFVPNLILP